MYVAVTYDVRLLVLYILHVTAHYSVTITDTGGRGVNTLHSMNRRLHVMNVFLSQYLHIVIVMSDQMHEQINETSSINMYIPYTLHGTDL